MKDFVRTYEMKPRQVKAVEWNGDQKVLAYLMQHARVRPATKNTLHVDSCGITVEAKIGDYIVFTGRGELVVTPGQFDEEYRLADWERERDSDMWPTPFEQELAHE